MKENETKQEIITRLGLQPHPEGGYFVEAFRSPQLLSLPDGRVRAASTAVYYLLPFGVCSAWHRVSSDEVWHFYGGAPLRLVTIEGEGNFKEVLLGDSLAEGQLPQHVIPAGVWQAAKPEGGVENWSLLGCTVAPGFDFEDFEMPDHGELLELFPQHQERILEFTNP
jgi:predicted cupin superfamily sugar epimerase